MGNLELTELGRYILNLCESNRLTMRKASMKAGLAPETISKILRSGDRQTPRPETLRLIADNLGGSYDEMMRMAGHLPSAPASESGDIGPEARAALAGVLNVWKRIKDQDPDTLRYLITLTRMQADLAQTLLEQARTQVTSEEPKEV